MVLIDALNLYGRDFIDKYNDTVRAVQHYFSGDSFESEYDYEVQSFLYQAGIPRKSRNLLEYMDRYGLDWSDLNTDKTLSLYSSHANTVKVFNWVSRNVDKLYK